MNLSISANAEPTKPQSQQLSAADQTKLKAACQDFESVFFGMMLKEMRKTVPTDTLLGDDAHEQEIFQGMMDDSVAKQMASHGGSDSLAQEMYRQLAGVQQSMSAAESGTTK
jgi:peptidoglycan hydrolase FlgJ